MKFPHKIPAIAAIVSAAISLCGEAQHLAPVEQPLGEVVGATHVGGKYALTHRPFLKEGADRIMEMGSRTIKLWLNNRPGVNYPYNSNWGQYLLGLKTVTDLIRTPYYREALDLPFATVVLMTTEFAAVNWKNGMNETEKSLVRAELQELTEHLLTEYKGSGKTFIISNWESDNNIRLSSVSEDLWPVYIQGMIDWTNARQDGIIAGRDAVGMDGVAVFGAYEVNHIPVHKSFDWPVTIDVVVPHTYHDIYSYSNWGTKVPGEEWQIVDNLDYIASKAPPSPFFGSRNVFLGEWGAYEVSYMKPLDPSDPEDTRVHDADSDLQQREVVIKNLDYALRWGIPYALYWQLYGNGLRAGESVPLGQMADERQLRGVWLIRAPSELLDLPYSYTSTWGSLAQLTTLNRLYDDLHGPEGMASHSAGLRFVSSVRDWAIGDNSRIAPASGGGASHVEYITAEEIRDFHLQVFDSAPADLADKLRIEVSADGTEWQAMTFSVNFIRSVGSSGISRAYLWPSGQVAEGMRQFKVSWIDPAGDFPQIGAVGLFTGDRINLEVETPRFAHFEMTSGNWTEGRAGADGSAAVLVRTDNAAGWLVHRANAIDHVQHQILSAAGDPPSITYSFSFDGHSWQPLEAVPMQNDTLTEGWELRTWRPATVPAGTRYIRLDAGAGNPETAMLAGFSLRHSPKAVSVDSDGDGWLDFEETWLGTDPDNALDRLRVEAVRLDTGGLQFILATVPGTRYRVQRLLDAATWNWEEWRIFEADSGSTTLTDPEAEHFPLCFYRVGLAPW